MIGRLETLGINEWKNEVYELASNLARVEQLMATLTALFQDQQAQPEAINEEKDNEGIDITPEEMADSAFGQSSNTTKRYR